MNPLMNRRLMLMGGLSLSGLAVMGCAGPAQADRPPPGHREPPPRMERDLPYGKHPDQRLDAYFPRGPRSGAVIVLVHGGGWRIGDKALRSVVDNKLERWLPQGHVVVSVNYRLLPDADPLEQARDVARAMAFVQGQARHWEVDADRIVLMGHSAGAHLAALVTADRQLAGAHGVRPWAGTVSLDSAALDVPALMQGRPLRLHREAFGDDPHYWRQVSPVHQLDTRPQPMMLVYAARREESRDQNQRMARAVQKEGGRVVLQAVELSHREINAELGRPGPYTEAVEAFMASVGVHPRGAPPASAPPPRQPSGHWQSRL
ncbi:MAG: alpha/beta hydrolase [Caldimonas sp.]|uniref:alpha/beta hydrolase n=1 Tax=Caldimonas sp. TaxID=2838790 RepID=UPI00391CA044